ncbi:MAG: sugar phosphate nucleotidyltransferase [candidate division WOR-3 bacterium]|nr:sugar phosphate nucleotidyltransferase [candidate division WOR-3 bacterium]
MKLYAVILAGGKGERFWPKSRSNFPKQFIALFGKDSLIQKTHKRIKKIIPTKNQFFVISQELAKILAKQITIPKQNIIYEPIGKNTAPAIALAAIYLDKIDPEGTMIVLPSDHLIKDEQSFYQDVKFAYEIAQQDYLVTFGIPATSPETGYGYIHIGDEFRRQNGQISYIGLKFVEKPDLALAKKYLQAKTYLWNSGMFVWRISAILNGIKEYLPEFYDDLIRFQKYIGTAQEWKVLKKLYQNAPATSIDYAVLEKSDNIIVVKANFVWDDVGSWLALERHFVKDNANNVILGKVYYKDTENSIIVSDKNLVATMGIKNLIIVQTNDALLVISKEKASALKELIKIISQEKNGIKYL